MITKAQVKEIRSLALPKGRAEWGAYAVEGDKLAREWLASALPLRYIAGTPEWLSQNAALCARHPEAAVLSVSDDELQRLSSYPSPNGALVVAPLPRPPKSLPVAEWCIVAEAVQDPGNLGTIIRIADWFGVPHVVCSPGCADLYNPKVLGAAMGGHLRVMLHVASLAQFLPQAAMPVLAATLDGTSVFKTAKPAAAALLIGNESKGLSDEALSFATERVTIPRLGGAESLNAAVSAGILLSALLND